MTNSVTASNDIVRFTVPKDTEQSVEGVFTIKNSTTDVITGIYDRAAKAFEIYYQDRGTPGSYGQPAYKGSNMVIHVKPNGSGVTIDRWNKNSEK